MQRVEQTCVSVQPRVGAHMIEPERGVGKGNELATANLFSLYSALTTCLFCCSSAAQYTDTHGCTTRIVHLTCGMDQRAPFPKYAFAASYYFANGRSPIIHPPFLETPAKTTRQDEYTAFEKAQAGNCIPGILWTLMYTILSCQTLSGRCQFSYFRVDTSYIRYFLTLHIEAVLSRRGIDCAGPFKPSSVHTTKLCRLFVRP